MNPFGGGNTLGSAVLVLTTDQREYEKGLTAAEKKAKQSGDAMERDMKKAAAVMATAAAAIGGFSLKMAIDFDSSMTKSLAIMGNVSDTMRNEMSSAAREMAMNSTFSANQVADSYFFLASAGLDAKAAITALPTVTKFAQAGMFDMALATDLLTDAQSALGLTVRDDAVANLENMVRISDVLVKANVLANASVQQFSESLTNKAGAALKVTNKDLEEGVAILAVFADQGLKGSAAGEALDITLRDLQTSARENSSIWAAYNLSVFDSQGNLRHTADIIEDLTLATRGMSDETFGATLAALGFQDRSVKNIKLLLDTQDALRDYEAQLRSAGGITEEVANKQLQSMSAQLAIMRSKAIDASITLGNAMIPVLRESVDAGGSLIETFAKLPESTQQLVMLGTVAALAGPKLILLAQSIVQLRLASLGVAAPLAAFVGLLATLDVVTEKATGTSLLGMVFGESPQQQARAKKAMSEWEAVTESATAGTDQLALAMGELDRITKQAGGSSADLAKRSGGLKGAFEVLASPIYGYKESLFGANQEQVDAIENTKELEVYVRLLAGVMKSQNADIIAQAQAYNALPPALRPVFDEVTGITAKMETNAFTMAAAKRATDGWLGSLNFLRPAVAETHQEVVNATPTIDAWTIQVALAEDGTREFEAAIKDLTNQFATTNPIVVALNAQHAKLTEELEDLKAKGDDLTKAEKARIKQIEDELLPAINAETKMYGDNQKAVEGMQGALLNLMGPAGYQALLAVMDEAGVAWEDQVDVQGRLADAYSALVNDDIPAAIGAFGELKGQLDPEVWRVIAEALGPKLVSAIADGIADPIQKAKVIAELDAVLDGAISAGKVTAEGGKGIGEALAFGIAQGIIAAKPGVIYEGSAMIQDIITAAYAVAEARSPSRVMMRLGEFMGDGLVLGIDARKQEVSLAAESIIKLAVTVARDATVGIDTTVGLPFSQGIADGILAGKQEVSNAAVSVVEGAAEAAKAARDKFIADITKGIMIGPDDWLRLPGGGDADLGPGYGMGVSTGTLFGLGPDWQARLLDTWRNTSSTAYTDSSGRPIAYTDIAGIISGLKQNWLDPSLLSQSELDAIKGQYANVNHGDYSSGSWNIDQILKGITQSNSTVNVTLNVDGRVLAETVVEPWMDQQLTTEAQRWGV